MAEISNGITPADQPPQLRITQEWAGATERYYVEMRTRRGWETIGIHGNIWSAHALVADWKASDGAVLVEIMGAPV